ncbi:MAG: BON domain-containing protein [Collimonas sp.]|uniref:BON domain-containing protein n=1 Tax=Collimonas sp. TaxID=1963772 RepID=UPI0032665422
MVTQMNGFVALATMIICVLSVNVAGCNNAQSEPVFISSTMINVGADDSLLATKIRTELMDSRDIVDLDIRIRTERDVVLLSGFADNQAQIDRSIALVRRIVGVRRVVSHIAIRQFT